MTRTLPGWVYSTLRSMREDGIFGREYQLGVLEIGAHARGRDWREVRL